MAEPLFAQQPFRLALGLGPPLVPHSGVRGGRSAIALALLRSPTQVIYYLGVEFNPILAAFPYHCKDECVEHSLCTTSKTFWPNLSLQSVLSRPVSGSLQPNLSILQYSWMRPQGSLPGSHAWSVQKYGDVWVSGVSIDQWEVKANGCMTLPFVPQQRVLRHFQKAPRNVMVASRHS